MRVKCGDVGAPQRHVAYGARTTFYISAPQAPKPCSTIFTYKIRSSARRPLDNDTRVRRVWLAHTTLRMGATGLMKFFVLWSLFMFANLRFYFAPLSVGSIRPCGSIRRISWAHDCATLHDREVLPLIRKFHHRAVIVCAGIRIFVEFCI